MTTAMKAIKRNMTVNGTTGDLSRLKGASAFHRLHLPLFMHIKPSHPDPPRPLMRERHLGRGWGQVHSGGAFPRPVFPSSLWNFQTAKGPRHWMPARPLPALHYRSHPTPGCRWRTSALPAWFPETPRFPCCCRICKKPKPRPRPSGAVPRNPARRLGAGPARKARSELGGRCGPSPTSRAEAEVGSP